MENENGHPFGDEWANREPMDPRQLREAITEWGQNQRNVLKEEYKTCIQIGCVFHRSANEEQSNGGCGYFHFMLDHPELRPKDGKCMRGCLPGEDCIRYLNMSESKLKKILKPKEQKKPKAEPQKPEPQKPVLKVNRCPKLLAQDIKRMALYKAGLNDQEIAARTGVGNQAIYSWRKVRGLPPNYDPSDPKERQKRSEAIKAGMEKRKEIEKKISSERMELYTQGKTDEEIARIQGVKRQAVGVWRRSRGLMVNGRKEKNETERDD